MRKRNRYYVADAEGKQLGLISAESNENARKQAEKKYPGYAYLLKMASAAGDLICIDAGDFICVAPEGEENKCGSTIYLKVLNMSDPFGLYCYNTGKTEEYASQEEYLSALIQKKSVAIFADYDIFTEVCDGEYDYPKCNDYVFIEQETGYYEEDLDNDISYLKCRICTKVIEDKTVWYLLEQNGAYFMRREYDVIASRDGIPFYLYECRYRPANLTYEIIKHRIHSYFRVDGGLAPIVKCQAWNGAEKENNVFYARQFDDTVYREKYSETDIPDKQELLRWMKIITPSMKLASEWEEDTKKTLIEAMQQRINEIRCSNIVFPEGLFCVYGRCGTHWMELRILRDGEEKECAYCVYEKIDKSPEYLFSDGTKIRVERDETDIKVCRILIEKEGAGINSFTKYEAGTSNDTEIKSDILKIRARVLE